MKRNTLQRDSISQVIAEADRPLSVEEILERAKLQVPALGLATVYRALKSFREEGMIREVDLPGQASRWETAGKGHHHHFLCGSCNKLFEIKGCTGGLKRLVPRGYTLEEHKILLQGQCGDCSADSNGMK